MKIQPRLQLATRGRGCRRWPPLSLPGSQPPGSSRLKRLIPSGQFLSCIIQIEIREAELSDTAIIAEFSSRLAWETEQRRLDPDLLRAGVAALLHDDAKGKYFLAESGAGS